MLKTNPEVLAQLQTKLHYFMVDEYQDTNTVQEAIVLLLAGKNNNLCVVGDDDQALYRFRGATVRNILEFPQRLTGCTRIELIDNYRSQPDIVEFYDRRMSGHEWRHDGVEMRHAKKLNAVRPAASAAPQVIKVTAEPGDWEAEVLAFLKTLHATGKVSDWNQVAFLFRSVRNDRVLALARKLEAANIPVYSPRSNLFFERDEVRLMVGAMIVLFPQFGEVVKADWKGEPPPLFEWYEGCQKALVDAAKDSGHADMRRWLGFRRKDHVSLAGNTDYAFSGLFYELLSFPLFAAFLTDARSLGGVRDSRAAHNLATLSRLLTRFESWRHIKVLSPEFIESNLRNLFSNYLRFLYEGGIDEFEDEADYAPTGCVAFMTVHQAKGLQFPVTIVGLPATGPRKGHTELDEILQRDHYLKPALEPLERTKDYDFWRLYYTAFSRAQDLLVLTTPEKLEGSGRKIPCAEFHDVCTNVPAWRKYKRGLAALELSKPSKADLKSQYSFTSHVAVFENCARQYQFFKELAFTPVRSNAILFGTLVHQTIEDIHKATLRGESALVTETQVGSWFDDNYRHLSKRERSYLSATSLKSALRHVLQYVEHRAGDWTDIVAAEVDVSLVQQNYILKGSIDLVQGDDDSVDIVDFKAEQKPDLVRDAERIRRYRRQLEVYGHLVQQRQGKKVRKLHLHYTGTLSGNPRISFEMNQTQVERTIGEFDAVVDRIERRDFSIAERPMKLCEACDMKHYCDRKE